MSAVLTLASIALLDSSGCVDYDPRRTRALELHASGAHEVAAREFLALWRDCPRAPRDLHNAASSYFLARRHGEALTLWSELDGVGELEPELRRELDAAIADARLRTTELTVDVEVGGAARADAVRLSICDEAEERCAADVRIEPGAQRLRVFLDEGEWVLRVASPAAPEVRRSLATRPGGTIHVIATAGTRKVKVDRPRPAGRPAPVRAPATGAVLVGGGIAVAGAGAALGLVGWQRAEFALLDEPQVCESAVACANVHVRGANLRQASMMLVTAGLSLAGAAALPRPASPIRRRRVEIAGVATGVALVAAGAAMWATGRNDHPVHRGSPPEALAGLERSTRLMLGGGASLGLGLGLAVGAATRLVVDAVGARKRAVAWSPALTREFAGLVLRREF